MFAWVILWLELEGLVDPLFKLNVEVSLLKILLDCVLKYQNIIKVLKFFFEVSDFLSRIFCRLSLKVLT